MIDVALCIGINRYGHGSDLAGCLNDANDWADALTARGADVRTLLDGMATRAAILAGMEALIGQLKRGRTGVITYSGHGTWLPDADGDEADGRDEAICPADLWDAGVITDDVLFDLFTDRPYGSRLVFISDSCHSGTVNRLAPPIGSTHHRARFLAPSAFLAGRPLELAQAMSGTRARGRSRSSALTMSGCADLEYSYDAWFGSRPNGAFSRVAIDALGSLGEGATFRDWHRVIRELLPSQDYPQTPQLAATASQKRWPLP